MSQLSALYYPHTHFTDQNLIKNSLLLWDKVSYIVPTENWMRTSFSEKVYNEALDILAEPIVPADEEKKQVHERVAGLIKIGIPKGMRLEAARSKEHAATYPVYPEKLGEETWNLLREESLAEFDWRDEDYHMNPYFGLMIMSLLADACAGKTRTKITDRAEAYSMLQQYLTAELGGEYVVTKETDNITSAYQKLINLSVKVLNTDEIPIENLVAMRQQEIKSHSQDYRNLRLNYLQKIESYVNLLSANDLSKRDINDIQNQFELEMQSLVVELSEALMIRNRKLMLSKYVLMAVCVAAGSLLHLNIPPEYLAEVSGVVGVGSFVNDVAQYRSDRKEALRKNAMSWLYLANKG